MINTLGPSLANSLLASAVFLYLWNRDRAPHLAIWAAAWVLWAVRYSYGLILDQVLLEPNVAVLPILALARGGLMLWGTYAFLRRRSPLPGLPSWPRTPP